MTPRPLDKRDIKILNEQSYHPNYLGEYIPTLLWEDLGNDYLSTFSLDDRGNVSPINLNVKAITSRINSIKDEETISSVLDVGCGFGRVLAYLNKIKIAPRIVGIEKSQSMINSSRIFFERILQPLPTIIKGDVFALPFKDEEFDLSYTHVVLTHIHPKDVKKAQKEISRVTKKFIIHIERYIFPYEHYHQYRWSHDLVPYYEELGWENWEYAPCNTEHGTKILVLKK